MANEYKRSRVYYTKAQIQNGLITSGKEWMFTDNVEYIGQYHRYTTGEVFSQASWTEGKSRQLIPYVDMLSITTASTDEIGMNAKVNFEYDSIKNLDIKPSSIPNVGRELITDDDLKIGYFVRYFAYKRNDGRCLELSKEKFNKIGQKDSLDDVMWEKIEIKWKIKGVLNDILDSNNNIVESGVYDTNKRTVALLSEKYPNLKFKLSNYTEYYQQ